MSMDKMYGGRGSIYYLSVPVLSNNKPSCPAYLIIPELDPKLNKPLMLVIVKDAQGKIRGAEMPPLERTISQQAEDDVTAIDTLAKKYLDSITDPSLSRQNINIALFEAKLLELLDTTCTPKRGYPGYASTLLKTYVNLMCGRIIDGSYNIITDPSIITSLGTWKGNDNTLFSRIKQPDDDDILKSFREMVKACILPCSDESENTEIQAKNEAFKNYLDQNMNALASIVNKDVINGKLRHHGSVYSRTSTLEDIITEECLLKGQGIHITEKFRRILWCYQRALWLHIKMVDMHPQH